MSDDLRFHVPPSYQGQIVEVSYALTPVGVVERIYDRSDRTTSYRVASWTSKLERWSESSGPWNTPPPSARWRRLTTNDRRELGLDESVHHATKKKSPAQLQHEIDEVLARTVPAAKAKENHRRKPGPAPRSREINALIEWMRSRRVRADANPYNPRVLRLVALDGYPETRWAEHLTPKQERALLSIAAETTNVRSW